MLNNMDENCSADSNGVSDNEDDDDDDDDNYDDDNNNDDDDSDGILWNRIVDLEHQVQSQMEELVIYILSFSFFFFLSLQLYMPLMLWYQFHHFISPLYHSFSFFQSLIYS